MIYSTPELYAAAADAAGLPSWALGATAVVASLVTLVGAVTAAVLALVTARRIGKPNGGGPVSEQVATVRRAVAPPDAPPDHATLPDIASKVAAIAVAVTAEPEPEPAPTTGPTSTSGGLWGAGG